MTFLESLKKPFMTNVRTDKAQNSLSNDPDLLIRTKELTQDNFGGSIVINGDKDVSFDYGFGDTEDRFQHQNRIITSYRTLATNDEVSNGIDIITNEVIWTVDDDVFKISIDEENEKITEEINKVFKNVLGLLNIKENIYNIARQFYIDGQLNVALAYDQKKVKSGIKSVVIVEPFSLYFDKADKKWKYNQTTTNENLYETQELDPDKNSFTESEMVHIDYDLYTKVTKDNEYTYQVNLGYLENVFKNANLLQTLENMLVPLRYSRSVSRRLFNIDVADMPPKQAKELMDKIREEFRYKKSYDPATGSITNIKGMQSLVEDYWMSNRGGAKGTTVDTMDEKGSLMEMDDIEYAAKKLYSSLKIPTSRNPYSDEQPQFSFEDTSITQEELSFYIFVSRIRIPLTTLIKEIMRRELVATGIFKDAEWKGYQKKINVSFTAESIFLENMKKEQFMKNVESFIGIKENIGQTLSLTTAVENTFSWSTEQLADELQKIEDERKNPLFKGFYSRDEGQDQDASWR